MKKILITGGAGFIGSHILEFFKDKGHFCVVIDDLSTGKIENTTKADLFYKVDIRDFKGLKEVFKIHKFDAIIHQAAQVSVNKSIKDQVEDANINIIGSINLINLCKEFDVNKIIVASTAAVYGNKISLPIKEDDKLMPLCPYGISKLAMENYVKCSGLNYGILRYSNVYGPRQYLSAESGVISIFCNNVKNSISHTVFGSGEQTRDFIYVEDVAKIVYNYFSSELRNQIINVSSNSSITINQLISCLSNISKKELSVNYKEPRIGEIDHSRLDNSRIKNLKIINCDLINMENGIKKTLNNLL